MRPGILIWFGAAAAAIVLAACGSTSAGSAGTSPPSSSAAPTSTSSSPAAAATVDVATVTVAGSSEQVLTTPSGFTLYYLTSDTPTKATCTGGCAGFWPPVLQPSGQPSAAAGVSGALSVFSNPNGQQVEYNGHLLYRYSGDTAAGQANGEGIKLGSGTWHVATPSLAMASGGSASASASASYSGY